MRPSGRFEQPQSTRNGGTHRFSLVRHQQWAHNLRMGEKPLSIDERPAQARMSVGGGPLGGDDAPPPAASINTTRSNIKAQSAVAGPPPIDGADGGTPGGVLNDGGPPDTSGGATVNTTRSNIKSQSAAGAPPPIDGADGGSPDGVLDDVPPDTSGAASINTTRSNIPSSGAAAVPGTESGGASTDGRDDPAGIAIKEQGVR